MSDRELVTTIPPGYLNKVGRVTAKDYPTTVVYGDQRVKLAAGESAAVKDGKIVKVA